MCIDDCNLEWYKRLIYHRLITTTQIHRFQWYIVCWTKNGPCSPDKLTLPVCIVSKSCQYVRALKIKSILLQASELSNLSQRQRKETKGTPILHQDLERRVNSWQGFLKLRDPGASRVSLASQRRWRGRLMSVPLSSAVTPADWSRYKRIVTPLAPSHTNTSDSFWQWLIMMAVPLHLGCQGWHSFQGDGCLHD